MQVGIEKGEVYKTCPNCGEVSGNINFPPVSIFMKKRSRFLFARARQKF